MKTQSNLERDHPKITPHRRKESEDEEEGGRGRGGEGEEEEEEEERGERRGGGKRPKRVDNLTNRRVIRGCDFDIRPKLRVDITSAELSRGVLLKLVKITTESVGERVNSKNTNRNKKTLGVRKTRIADKENKIGTSMVIKTQLILEETPGNRTNCVVAVVIARDSTATVIIEKTKNIMDLKSSARWPGVSHS